jgi:hypothetical protein
MKEEDKRKKMEAPGRTLLYSGKPSPLREIAEKHCWSGGTGRRTGLKIPRPSLGMWVRPPPPAPLKFCEPAKRAAAPFLSNIAHNAAGRDKFFFR